LELQIRAMQKEDIGRVSDIDGSFVVDSILVLSMTDQHINYTITPVDPYTKNYNDHDSEEEEEVDEMAYIDHPDQIMYLAILGEQVVGHITLSRHWNHYAYIDDIRVDKSIRHRGIGSALIEAAKRWALEGGMPGIMLETQNNNVKACQFYEKCGFTLGGFDRYLYQGLNHKHNEIALYWYLLFES